MQEQCRPSNRALDWWSELVQALVIGEQYGTIKKQVGISV
jgi:hypothetical protein